MMMKMMMIMMKLKHLLQSNLAGLHGHLGVWVVHLLVHGWHGQQEGVEDGAGDDAHHEDPHVVAQLVGEEAHKWRGDEDAEGQDGVPAEDESGSR